MYGTLIKNFNYNIPSLDIVSDTSRSKRSLDRKVTGPNCSISADLRILGFVQQEDRYGAKKLDFLLFDKVDIFSSIIFHRFQVFG